MSLTHPLTTTTFELPGYRVTKSFGVVRGITIHFAPAAGEASIYIQLFVVLLVRPRGLLGERIEKFE